MNSPPAPDANGARPSPPGVGRDRATIESLRIGLGLVWLANLGFVVDPSNRFFGTFAATAGSLAPTAWPGPELPRFVAAHPAPFAVVVAVVTAFLAVGFLFGVATRLACAVGIVFSLAILFAQAGSTFATPGGTDVGPHPLYILLGGLLLIGRAGSAWSVDAWLRRHATPGRFAAPSRPLVPAE